MDPSQVRLAIRSSIKAADEYILLDREGNRLIACKSWSQGEGEDAGIMHEQYVEAGGAGHIPVGKVSQHKEHLPGGASAVFGSHGPYASPCWLAGWLAG